MAHPFITTYSTPINGPRALFGLMASHMPRPAKIPEDYIIGLDEAMLPTVIRYEAELPSPLIELTSLIFLRVAPEWPQDFIPAQLQDLKALSQRYSTHNKTILDVLLLSGTRWWSALCVDSNCCPQEGNLIEKKTRNRAEIWSLWESSCRAIPGDDHQLCKALIDSLDDIQIRDCVLVAIASAREAHDDWQLLLNHLLHHCDSDEQRAVFRTFFGAQHYLNDNLDGAKREIETALCLDASYSLAQLLSKGLESKAPAGIVQKAFTRYSIEQLLAR